MKKLFVIALLLTSYQALAQYKPYKIAIFTDGEAKVKAEEFKAYLQTKPPFSKMGEKLTLEIVELTADEMNCSNSMPDAPRIVTCDTQLLRKKQRNLDAHFSVAFTSRGDGGAGGDLPVATKSYPIQTMFHEMLHTYGFADEYDYKDSEIGVYCKNPRSSVNIVYFHDVPPYDSDVAARDKHAKDVPWMGGIPMARTITQGTSLGSKDSALVKPGDQLLGLYRGGQCDSALLPGWRPYNDSIMRGYYDDTIYPLYEEVIVKNIEGSLGRKLNLPPPPEKCLDENYDFSKLQHLHNDVEEAVKHAH